jgi:NAD(P)H dehydrogenase (quinone)
MILVTGATGHFGKATINFLLQKGISANNISALIRDLNKAADLKSKGVNLKIGDYDNYASLVQAFKGVDKLLLVSGSDVEKRGKQQENAVKAAVEAGVKHILYTSFERKNESDNSPIAFIAKTHMETEKQIKASGLTYTIFRNNLYMESLPMFLGEKVLETGIFLPTGDTKSAFATRTDMAEVAANVLMGSGHENKDYFISNSESYSLQDVADVLSKITGKNVSYVSPAKEVYVETLAKAGVPPMYIQILSGFAEGIKQGEFNTGKHDMEKLLGRKPATLHEYLQQIYSPK